MRLIIRYFLTHLNLRNFSDSQANRLLLENFIISFKMDFYSFGEQGKRSRRRQYSLFHFLSYFREANKDSYVNAI